jgi:hypothetical protein
VYRLMYHLCNTQNANFSWLNAMSAGIDRAISFLYWILTRLH